ncbi:hypothetical protein, partial [Raoultella ornithinolytica]|uniref:hypothetical protein n=1 Tax=Raoultella ornithinolytica TaxID=54291 RepID=UPI0028755D34|nr:hypothetical protein [Raoultella ornithinolytica]
GGASLARPTRSAHNIHSLAGQVILLSPVSPCRPGKASAATRQNTGTLSRPDLSSFMPMFTKRALTFDYR